MNRLLTCTAVAWCIGLTPALAAEDTSNTSKSSAGQTMQKDMNTNESGASAPATQPGATPEAAEAAKNPAEGSPDTSGGATERSSAPPESEAATMQKSTEAQEPAEGTADPSGGAKERSSAPPGSSAADPSKPNPTLGSDDQEDQPN